LICGLDDVVCDEDGTGIMALLAVPAPGASAAFSWRCMAEVCCLAGSAIDPL